MQRYWDLEEKERAALTEEQVQALLAVELMERGVLMPVEPTPSPVPVAPRDLARSQVWTVRVPGRYGEVRLDIGFKSPGDCRAFLALGPVAIVDDYDTGATVGQAITDDTATPVEVVDGNAHASARAALTERKAIMAANEKARADYIMARAKADKETAQLRGDWRRCRDEEAERAKVRKTHEEYLRLTAGNADLARTFLEKAFPAPLVREALGLPEASDAPRVERKPPARVDGAGEEIPF